MFKRLIASFTKRQGSTTPALPVSKGPSVPPVTLTGGPGRSHYIPSAISRYEPSAASDQAQSSADVMASTAAFMALDLGSSMDASPSWSGYDAGTSDFSGGGGDFGGGGSDGGW